MNQEDVISVELLLFLIGRIYREAKRRGGTLYVQFNLTYWQQNSDECTGKLVCGGNSTDRLKERLSYTPGLERCLLVAPRPRQHLSPYLFLGR
jgi:hypothetical protein